MMSINSFTSMLITPNEEMKNIALRARERRLELNLSQKTLSSKSGVSYGVIKKFEATGQISLESLLKLALPLRSLKGFYSLFYEDKVATALTLQDLMKDATRQRGRK